MSKHIQLSIADPCHEDWDQMTPAEKGRFCASCQKQVTDFSNMSDSQVAAFFKKPSTGSVCGRFFQDQLDRNIEIPRKRIPWVKYFFQFALPAFLLSMKANAQKKTIKMNTEVSAVRGSYTTVGFTVCKETTLPFATDLLLNGSVIDHNKAPVPFASLMVKGKNGLGISADSNGTFKLKEKTVEKDMILEVSSVGYITKEIMINKDTDLTKAMIIELEPRIMDNVVVVSSQTVMGAYRVGGVCVRTTKEEIETLLIESPQEILPPLKIYPNPVTRNSSLHIEFNNDRDETMQFIITSMSGNIVLQRKEKILNGINRLSVTADSRWAAGIYIIRLTNENGKMIKQEKIVVQ